jgi:gamma-glutamylcyclotransferase
MLPAYRLVFNKLSRDKSGKANLHNDPSAAVWGVLYSIPDDQLDVLDRGEGKGYRRQSVRLYAMRGTALDAWAHIAVAPSTDSTLRPYSWYKQFLVEGAKEHGLPVPYIEALETIAAVEDPDVTRDQERRELM